MVWNRRRGHKYNAVRVEIDGHRFASKAEARHYQELKLRQKVGEIWGLVLQPSYTIQINGVKVCKVVLDFLYFDKESIQHNVDVKGRDLPLSRLKRKLLKAVHNIDVEVIR